MTPTLSIAGLRLTLQFYRCLEKLQPMHPHAGQSSPWLPSRVSGVRLALLMLLGGVAGEAGELNSAPGFLWQQWTREHGLPDNRVLGVVQTDEGQIWAATPTGLARFDGRHWEGFYQADVPGFLTNGFHQMVADVQGGLWIRLNFSLVRWNGRAFSRRIVQKEVEWIGPMHPSSQGGIWAPTEAGLWFIRDDKETCWSLPWPVGLRDLKALREKDRKLWIGLACGILRLDLTTDAFDEVRRDPDAECKYAKGFAFDAQGELWVLNQPLAGADSWLAPCNGGVWTTNRGITVYNETRDTFLLSDGRGQLWFPGGQGRISFLRDGRRFDVSLPGSASQDFALAMAEDLDGGLWVATENSGLLRLRPAKVQTLSAADGLPHEAVWALLESRDGSIWIGTDGGLSRWRNGRFTHWTEDEGLSRNAVRALAEDAQGRIWIGTGAGLSWIEHGQLNSHHLPGQWFNSKIRTILAGRNDMLWLGTVRGLNRFEPAGEPLSSRSPLDVDDSALAVAGAISGEGGSRQRLPFAITAISEPTNALQPADVLAVLEDRAGTLWVGTADDGLRVVQDGYLQPFRPNGFAPHSVWALHEDEQGALWLGTEKGLARLKDNRGFTFAPKHGLPDDFVNHIAQDDRSHLWLAGERGIYRLNKRDLDEVADGRRTIAECVTYNEDEGMLTAETNGRKNQPGILKARDGRMWFATARGVAILDPENLPDQAHPPPVSLTRILATGQAVFDNAPGEQSSAETNPGTVHARALTAELPPGAGRVLEIHYTASSFVAADQLRFKHRLEGFDEAWTEAGTRRVAQYSNLPPGRYCFRVTAANKYGVWNEDGATFAFTLAPFVWQTAWFKTLAIVAPLLVGYGYYRRRLALQQRRAEFQRLAAVSAERAEIARDLHDHLGVRLTLVNQLTQSLHPSSTPADRDEAATQKLTELARELNASLDSAIWAVQPGIDTLASLADYLGDTFQELLTGTGIKLDLNFPEPMPAWDLSRTERYHLALCAIEALNNSIKHARPSLLRLHLEINESSFALRILDNGCGFDPKTPRAGQVLGRGGNGLANMRRRMKIVGGRCSVSSSPDHGTTVTFELSPAHRQPTQPPPRSTGSRNPSKP